jgi:hypothetical protein
VAGVYFYIIFYSSRSMLCYICLVRLIRIRILCFSTF